MKNLSRPSACLIVTAACFALGCGGSEFRAPGDATGGSGVSAEQGGGSGAASTARAGASSVSGAGSAGGAGNRAGAGSSSGSSSAGGEGNKGGAGNRGGSSGAGGSGNAHGGGTAVGGGGSANAGSSAGGALAGTGGSAGGAAGAAGAQGGDAGSGGSKPYLGPSVGTAKPFAVLAYSAVTSASISTLLGDIGVSAGAVSTITGFDAASDKKYGTDSLAPNVGRTLLAQQDVTKLVSNIDPRPCDADYTSVVGGLTGDVTLYPGVTCMNSFSDDVLLNGHLTLDAKGDHNAFFIIRGNLTLTVADAAQVVLANGAEACGVFWRISKQVTIGKAVQFYGTVIAGSAVTMTSGSKVTGRLLAQTASVTFDADTVTVPSDGLVGSAAVCTHLQ